jgi:hypothetical protein
MAGMIFIGMVFLMIGVFTLSFYRMINKEKPSFAEERDEI